MSDQEVNGQATPDGASEEQGRASPGAQLAAYRKERGWTTEQVASQLNLAPRQVVAIENDDYPALPGMPIVRGFIRAYAKLLKVDAAPLLAGLGGDPAMANESIAPRKTLSTPFMEARMPSMMTERPALSSKWIIGLLLAVLAGVVIWALQLEGDIVEISKSASSQVSDSLASLSGNGNGAKQAASAGAEKPAVPPAPAGETPSAPVPAAGSTDVVPQMTEPAPVDQATNAASPAPSAGNAAPTALAGDNALVLKAREDSWVEVRRADNNTVSFSRILKAGESESIEVTEPISIVIGNAAGVDVNLRGTPIELKPASKSNVARLSLK